MKRLFTLITSIVLATSLLAVPCFAAEPEDLPTPQTGVTETEQPEDPDESGMQLYDLAQIIAFTIEIRAFFVISHEMSAFSLDFKTMW